MPYNLTKNDSTNLAHFIQKLYIYCNMCDDKMEHNNYIMGKALMLREPKAQVILKAIYKY